MLLNEKPSPAIAAHLSSNPFAEAILSFIEEIKDNDDKKSIFYKEVVQVACRLSLADNASDQSLIAANDLSRYISELEIQHQKKSNTRKIFAWTQPLVEGLLQYTAAVDVMIQADPTVSALIYGGAKLVLQLANAYTKAFEQITQMMADIGVQLQYFHIYTQEFATDKYMSGVLCNSYRDILLFWRDASKILNQRGKRFLVGGLFAPLNERYLRFKEKLDKNAQNVRHMAQALHVRKQGAFNITHAVQIQNVTATLERTVPPCPPNYQQAENVLKHVEIRKWILGGRFSKMDPQCDLDRHLSSRHSGTAEWIFQNPVYEKWQRSAESCSIWMNAAPGSGKSVLAASVIETLLQSPKKEQQNTIYFFCRFDEPEKCKAITTLKSLAIQALKLIKYIPDELWQLYQDECSGDDCFITNLSIAERVLGLLLKRIEYIYIVVDGLDECKDEDLLEALIKLRDQKGFGITKWLFTSRNDAVVQKKFEKSTTEVLAVPKKVIQSDIRKFLEDNEDLLCSTCDQLDKITEMSQGNFLMMRLTTDPFRNEELTCSEEFEEALDNFQPELGRCWFRSLQRLSHRSGQIQELAQIIFRAVLLATQPMTFNELLDLLAVKIGEEPSPRRQRTRSVVLSACSPFIEPDYETDFVNPTLRLAHKSIGDLLLQEPDTLDYVTEDCYKFFVDPMAGNLDIGRRCLTYLSYKRYSDFTKVNTEGHDPQNGLLKYASIFWHRHLSDAGGDHELFQEVSNFLKSPNLWTCIRVQSKYAPHIFAKLSYDSTSDIYRMLMPNSPSKDDLLELQEEEYYADALPPWLADYDNRGDNLVWGYHMMVREWGEVLVRYPNKIQPYFAKVLGSRSFWTIPKLPSGADAKIKVKTGKRMPTWQQDETKHPISALPIDQDDPDLKYVRDTLEKQGSQQISNSSRKFEIGQFSVTIHRYTLKAGKEEEDDDSDDESSEDGKTKPNLPSDSIIWFLGIDNDEEKHWYHYLSKSGFLQKSQPVLIPDNSWLIWPQDETSILMINTNTWESYSTFLPRLNNPDQFILSQDHHYSPTTNCLHRASIYGTDTVFKIQHTIFPLTLPAKMASQPPKISPSPHQPQETIWRYPSLTASLPASFHWHQDDDTCDTLYAALGCPDVKILHFPALYLSSSSEKQPIKVLDQPLFIPCTSYHRNLKFSVQISSSTTSSSTTLTFDLDPFPRFDLPSVSLSLSVPAATSTVPLSTASPPLPSKSLGSWKPYNPHDPLDEDDITAGNSSAFLKGVYAAKEQAFSVPIRSGLDWRRSVYVTCW